MHKRKNVILMKNSDKIVTSILIIDNKTAYYYVQFKFSHSFQGIYVLYAAVLRTI